MLEKNGGLKSSSGRQGELMEGRDEGLGHYFRVKGIP